MRYLYVFILGLMALPAVAQNSKGCSAQPTEGFLQNYFAKDRNAYEHLYGARGTMRYIPVLYHVITRSDGTGGTSIKKIFDSHCELNQAYNPFDIGFYIYGIDSIQSTTLYNDVDPGSSNFNAYNTMNVCNVYVSPDLDVCGFATFPGWAPKGGGIFLNASCYGKETTTLQHEMGHWLGLLHTFQPTNPVEYVDGSNCSNRGDGFCDTPADFVDYRASCPYTGNQTDPKGDLYRDVIDETLYMSYFFDRCQDKFSPQQQAEMNATLTNDRPTLLNGTLPDLSPLPVTTFTAPLNGDTSVIANGTTFSWNNIPGAIYYHFTLQSATSNVIFADTIIPGTSFFTTSLAPNKSYKYRVQGLSYGNTCSPYTPDNEIKTSTIKATVAVTLPDCPGTANASILVSSTNGATPYSYSWSNGTFGNELTNLAPGNYIVTITDGNGEVAVATVEVKDPQPLGADIDRVGNNLNAYGQGGTPPYTYSWSNGVNGQFNNNVPPQGVYTVTITDSKGCVGTQTFNFDATGIEENTVEFNGVQLFPNPVSEGALKVLLTANNAGKAIITLANLSGQTVSGQLTELNQGENLLSINTGSLAPGVYLLTLKAGNYTSTHRFTVIK